VTAASLISIAGYSRYIRSNMLEVMEQDYIRTARAKGWQIGAWCSSTHSRTQRMPLVTIVGLDLPFLLAGAVVTESIFAGRDGRLFWEHTGKSDTPVLMGIIMNHLCAVIAFQLVTDLTYSLLDPRIRYD